MKTTSNLHFFSLSALIRIAIRQDLRAPRKFSDRDPTRHGDAIRTANDGRATKGDRFFQVQPGRSIILATRNIPDVSIAFGPVLSCPLPDWPQRDQPSQHDTATRRIGCPHLPDVRDDPQVCP